MIDFEKLGISLNEIIRYGYGGLLLFLVAAIVEPATTATVTTLLGSIFAGVVAFGIGSAIYVFYRPILGEYVVYPTYEAIHAVIDWLNGDSAADREGKSTTTCKLKFLKERCNVAPRHAPNAYRMIRDGLFDEDRRKVFNRYHSEFYLLYSSFTVFGAACAYILAKWRLYGGVLDRRDEGFFLAFALLSVLCLACGILADVTICRHECAHLKTMDIEKMRQLVQQLEFCERQTPKRRLPIGSLTFVFGFIIGTLMASVVAWLF